MHPTVCIKADIVFARLAATGSARVRHTVGVAEVPTEAVAYSSGCLDPVAD